MMTRREALRAMALSAAAVTTLSPLSLADDRAAAPRTAAPGAVKPAPGVVTSAKTIPDAGPFKLAALPYDYAALEPHIDAETMRIHHDKHHAAYVANLNKAVAGKVDLEKKTVEELIRDLDSIPSEIRTAVRNHGGGHANHSLFWTLMKKNPAEKPTGSLATAIDQAFGSFAGFREKFDQAAASVFGSGWAWLALEERKLVIETTPNQDSPLMQGHQPVLGIDVWEHAYYLKYQNRRPEYVAAFARVIDWDAVSARYGMLTKS